MQEEEPLGKNPGAAFLHSEMEREPYLLTSGGQPRGALESLESWSTAAASCVKTPGRSVGFSLDDADVCLIRFQSHFDTFFFLNQQVCFSGYFKIGVL